MSRTYCKMACAVNVKCPFCAGQLLTLQNVCSYSCRGTKLLPSLRDVLSTLNELLLGFPQSPAKPLKRISSQALRVACHVHSNSVPTNSSINLTYAIHIYIYVYSEQFNIYFVVQPAHKLYKSNVMWCCYLDILHS